MWMYEHTSAWCTQFPHTGWAMSQWVLWATQAQYIIPPQLWTHIPCTAFGQDPVHSDGDLSLYMWHGLLQYTIISCFCLSFTSIQHLLPSELTYLWATSLAHFHIQYLAQ